MTGVQLPYPLPKLDFIMYKNEQRKVWYWIKYILESRDWGARYELVYILKRKIKYPLCMLGMHKVVWDITWYYAPDSYCDRCDEQDATNWRIRYGYWASMHTMNPFAWPIAAYWMIKIKLSERHGPKE